MAHAGFLRMVIQCYLPGSAWHFAMLDPLECRKPDKWQNAEEVHGEITHSSWKHQDAADLAMF